MYHGTVYHEGGRLYVRVRLYDMEAEPTSVVGHFAGPHVGDRDDFIFTAGGAEHCLIGKSVLTFSDLRGDGDRVNWKLSTGNVIETVLATQPKPERSTQEPVSRPKGARRDLTWTPPGHGGFPGWYAKRKRGWVRV